MQSLLDLLPSNRKMSEHTRWLDAHSDRSAGVRVYTSRCLALCDTSGSGDAGLVLAEPRGASAGRLRVYRGAATLASDRPLHGPPSGLVAFYTDQLEPRVPAVAVAIGPDVLIYKNSKPYYKFTVPGLPVDALEVEVWRMLSTEGAYTTEVLQKQLASLKTLPFNELSPRSQRLLTLASDTEREEFVGRYLGQPPVRTSVVTCMAPLNRATLNPGDVACLVVATEAGHVYFLDPQGFSVLHQASVCVENNLVPTIICCSGAYDVEYRCVVCTRDGSVCLLRRDWLEGRRLFRVAATIVDMALLPADQHVVLATADGRLICHTKRGKQLWSISCGKSVSSTCLSLVPLPHLNTCLLAVGLRPQSPTATSGPILQLYQSRNIVDVIHLPDTPSAVRFGRLGQEENVLIIVTRDGSLLFKILKRTANFSAGAHENHSGAGSSSAVTAKPLPLPKRSKLFAEQTQRERQNAQVMHQTFQQDLIRLRLTASRATVQTLRTADQSVSDSVKHPIKLSAQVLGLGPRFTLTLTLENLSDEKSVSDLSVLLHVNNLKYRIDTPFVTVPMIPPELRFKIETTVIEVIQQQDVLEDNDESSSVPIRVFVNASGQTQPLLAATINMPPTDPLAFLI